MKHQPFIKLPITLTFILCFFLSTVLRSDAQIISASVIDTTLDIHNTSYPCSTDVSVLNPTALNCDLITTHSGDKLFAVAYTVQDIGLLDPNGGCFPFTYVPVDLTGVHVEYVTPWSGLRFGGYNREVFMPNGRNPDVVIGDLQPGIQGEYNLGIVYEMNNDVEIATCPIYNIDNGFSPATLGTISTGLALNDASNGRIATNPHIDMFGEYYSNNAHFNYFIATWTEHDGSGDYVMVAVGDINNPSAFVRTQITPNSPSDPQGIWPDVAAMKVLNPCSTCVDRKAFLTYVDPSNNNALMQTELDIDVFGNATIVGTPATLATGHIDIGKPRIESKNRGDIVSGDATWEIVASIQPTSNYEIHCFNDVITTPTICALSATENHFSPAVAGVGEDIDPVGSGKVGETQFSLAYYSTYSNSGPNNGDIFANSIDISGGTMSNTKYYEVNTSSLLQPSPYSIASDIPIAISTSSNSGNDLLTVWYRGYLSSAYWGEFDYKFSGNGYSFKPTGTFNIQKNTIRIYPNPANEVLNIEGATFKQYFVSDALGRIIYNGETSGNNSSIDISELKPGVYFLTINDINIIGNKIKFTKI